MRIGRRSGPLLDDLLLNLRLKLSDEDRRILVEHFIKERTLADIGNRLGLKPATAQKRSVRALEKLLLFN